MTTYDYRALCVELTDCLEKADWPLRHRYVFRQWIDIARAALADGPAVPEGREPAAVTGQPSDEELALIYHDCCRGCEFMDQVNFENAARAVLTRWGNPAPTPPADGEVAELVAWLREQLHVCLQAPWTPGIKHFGRAAELLERQALVPVAVSERMPESKDCDADGMCWWWSNVDGSWYLRRPSHPIVVCSADLLQIWLPAHALPLPEVGE